MARKHSKKGTEKHLILQCKQCTKEQEPKVDGVEERVPVGVHNRTHCGNLHQGSWNKSLNAVEEDKGDISEEVHEDENELHAWRLLEESENEQWQEVTSKKSKLNKKKKLDDESLLSVENNSGVHRSQRQLGKHQSHNGYRSCRACHASRDVPESETRSYELNKEIRCSNGERTKGLG